MIREKGKINAAVFYTWWAKREKTREGETRGQIALAFPGLQGRERGQVHEWPIRHLAKAGLFDTM